MGLTELNLFLFSRLIDEIIVQFFLWTLLPLKYTFFVCLPTKDLDKGFIQTVYSNSERISFVTLASLYIKGTSIGTMFMFVDCEIVSVKCLMKVRDVSRCVTFLET